MSDKFITWAYAFPATGLLPWCSQNCLTVSDQVLVDTDNYKFISTCVKAEVLRILPAGKLLPQSTPQCSWLEIALDAISDLPHSQQKTTILVIINI